MSSAVTTRIAVIYYSSTGNVAALAHALADGARATGADVRVLRVHESAPAEAIASNAPHIAGVLQILDREHPVEPQKVTLPDRLKIREIVVRQAPLAAYDALKKKGPTS